jgi:glycine/D-amino acid oxidase-like deaminating enzyme
MMAEPLPVAEADVVVIGAGAFGLSAAYHLAASGAGRVVVLDRFAPASQTSPRAAGLFKLVQADATLTRLAQLSIAIVRDFEGETGVPMPHVRSGSLLVARTAAHAAMVGAEAAASRGWGVDLELVDEREVSRLAPYFDGAGLLAACHLPGDIFVEEPATSLAAFREAAERRGAVVLGEAPVTGIRVERGRVAGVVTPRGEVRTETVVDAAGAWAAAVGVLAGVSVPVAPVRHQLRISGRLAGVAADAPIVRVVEAAVYVRPARGGLMLGGFEPDPLPLDPREAEPSFAIERTPLDAVVLDSFEAEVAAQVPALRGAAVAEHRAGLFTMTADGRFLLGPAAGVAGLWLATGCNGSGFSLSPALGRCLAEWIVGGAPEVDVRSLDPRRFGPGSMTEGELIAAGVWQYANYYTPAGTATERVSA